MSERIPNRSGGDPAVAVMEPEVVEVPLLLPGWQVAALADAARDRGLTAGEMLRHILRDFIYGLDKQQSYTIN